LLIDLEAGVPLFTSEVLKVFGLIDFFAEALAALVARGDKVFHDGTSESVRCFVLIFRSGLFGRLRTCER
jgi:hypothetical protein